MPPNICDKEANHSPDKLASTAKGGKTEAARRTLVHNLWREERGVPLAERLQPLLDEIAAAPKTRHEADKAFYDELGGDP